MRTRGTVITSENGLALISVCHKEFCTGCGHHDADQEQVEIKVLDPVGVVAGQKIEFMVDSRRMLSSVLLVFWAPILAAALGAFAGGGLAQYLGLNKTMGMCILGAVSCIIILMIIYVIGKKIRPGDGFIIKRVIPKEELNCS